MKKMKLAAWIAIAAISLTACTGNKKQGNANVKHAKDTISWEGTYEGIMPASGAAGIYTLVALDDDGEFEVFQKHLGKAEIFVTKGDIQWNNSGDTLTLETSKGLVFKLNDGALQKGNTTLSRISKDEELAKSYTRYLVKENNSGENYEVKLYVEDNGSVAELEIDGKEYELKEDKSKSSEQEKTFTDGTATLQWIVPNAGDSHVSTLTDGDKTFTFMHLSPTNYIYVTDDDDAPAKAFDVLFFNTEDGKSFVKLVSTNSNVRYTLPQVEASAKTGTYEKEGITWRTSNKNTADLIVNEKTYTYNETAMQY